MTTRGILDNNPGNIRLSDARWQGEVVGTDQSFETFDCPENGIRALAKLLRNYQLKHDLHTVANIIARWAPSNENDTLSYAKDVAGRVGVPMTKAIDLDDPVTLGRLTAAIISHENANFAYPPAVVAEGVRRALT